MTTPFFKVHRFIVFATLSISSSVSAEKSGIDVSSRHGVPGCLVLSACDTSVGAFAVVDN